MQMYQPRRAFLDNIVCNYLNMTTVDEFHNEASVF